MPIIRFYVLPLGADIERRLQILCKLCEKALNGGEKNLIIHCENHTLATLVDERLWQYPLTSFLPHTLSHDSKHSNDAPILITTAPERVTHADTFINLSLDTQADIPQNCQRVIEIVQNTNDVLSATRARYKAYQARGYTPETIKLSM
ncbi:DNA polymerase III subunit chi [Suttonella ornithocola]|uniref:DNA polymerase III subunit chi n=1 Tax=Suttonella ornithocola TaxID=279832 RepID=A0A380N0I5_9GAMM|nr:DNA polymerase III subunit chi [Suttonella ornithocola]SUO97431.1 DNA polymerase III subunit chi [Suttonella ornithocola]